MRKYVFRNLIIITLLTSTSASTTYAGTDTSKSKVPKLPCRIDVEIVHISTYLAERHAVAAIKANATSICDKPLTNLNFTVEIYKRGWFRNYLVGKTTSGNFSLVPAGKKITMRSAVALCRNWKKTTFFAKTYGTSYINGQLVQAPGGISEKLATIECGT